MSIRDKYQLSTHILDISQGHPAQGVEVQLEKFDKLSDKWNFVKKLTTNANGRIEEFLEGNGNHGIYKLIFYTSEYFQKSGIKSFYPFIEVVFEISDDTHYHVPITLSPFGYSTYRGS